MAAPLMRHNTARQQKKKKTEGSFILCCLWSEVRISKTCTLLILCLITCQN